MSFTVDDLTDFMKNIYTKSMVENNGGMHLSDMFSFYFLLKTLRPSVVVESGVWRGQSTHLIRKTLGDNCIIYLP